MTLMSKVKTGQKYNLKIVLVFLVLTTSHPSLVKVHHWSQNLVANLRGLKGIEFQIGP